MEKYGIHLSWGLLQAYTPSKVPQGTFWEPFGNLWELFMDAFRHYGYELF